MKEQRDLVLADHEPGTKAMGICKSAFNALELTHQETAMLLGRGAELRARLQRDISELVLRHGCDLETAQAIMGPNFFGVGEAMLHFGVRPGVRQHAALHRVPWSKEVLRACKDTHALVAVFPLSILQLRDRLPDPQMLFGLERYGYGEKHLARDRGELGWYLVRKEASDLSRGYNFEEQKIMLDRANEEVATARILVYATMGILLASGQRMFENHHVRCTDVTDSEERGKIYHLLIGSFRNRALIFDQCLDYIRNSAIGAGSIVKRR